MAKKKEEKKKTKAQPEASKPAKSVADIIADADKSDHEKMAKAFEEGKEKPTEHIVPKVEVESASEADGVDPKKAVVFASHTCSALNVRVGEPNKQGERPYNIVFKNHRYVTDDAEIIKALTEHSKQESNDGVERIS